jgi:hypothetical protein
MIQSVLLPEAPDRGFWLARRDADPDAMVLFSRHYSYRRSRMRKWAGGKFVGPGEYIVLVTPDHLALFVWRRFISMDCQEGVNCAVFRNEGPTLSSELILDAEQHARDRWPDVRRFYTYVNPRKVRSSNPGYCFIRAGWRRCGMTTKRLIVLEKRLEVAS